MREIFRKIGRALTIAGVPLILPSDIAPEREQQGEPVEIPAKTEPMPKGLQQLEQEIFAGFLYPELNEGICLDLGVAEGIKEYWKRKYQEDPRLRESLEKGYQAMQPYIKKLEEIFTREGVPAEYIYLALGESHWDPRAVSPSGAIGVFQILPETARKFGFREEDLIDPIENARAAAVILADLHDVFGDWDLVLSGYNSGFIWKYKAQRSPANRSYEDFLAFLAEEANQIRQGMNQGDLIHVVKKGQTLNGLSRHYGVTVEELKAANKMKSERILREQELIIPRNEKTIKVVFNKRCKGILENLKYPPKFNAIYELIQEGYVYAD